MQRTRLSDFIDSGTDDRPLAERLADELFHPGEPDPSLRDDWQSQRLSALGAPASPDEVYRGIGTASLSLPVTRPGYFEEIDEDTDLIASDLHHQVMTDGGQVVVEEDTDETLGFDPEEETVTDDWEGEYLYTSWGYGQTNVDLARIVEVSDTGKTVVARMCKQEIEGQAKGSQSVKPSGECYGDEFRLHVRNSGGDPAFRGSYPYLRGGDMAEGTRMGLFLPWGDKESVHQTAPGYGH